MLDEGKLKHVTSHKGQKWVNGHLTLTIIIKLFFLSQGMTIVFLASKWCILDNNSMNLTIK